MRRRAVAVGVLTSATLAVLYVGFARMAGETQSPRSRTFRLRIDDGRLTSGPSILQAVQGDTVTLLVASNRSIVVHLHEHEQHVVLEVTPGQERSSTFRADVAGRFGVHVIDADGSFVEVAVLQVHPR
jgi:plastocyanin